MGHKSNCTEELSVPIETSSPSVLNKSSIHATENEFSPSKFSLEESTLRNQIKKFVTENAAELKKCLLKQGAIYLRSERFLSLNYCPNRRKMCANGDSEVLDICGRYICAYTFGTYFRLFLLDMKDKKNACQHSSKNEQICMRILNRLEKEIAIETMIQVKM